MPLGYRRADEQPTTRAILDAAHRVLLRSGTKGLTLVAVAREAHVDVTTVSYHFGTRLGLIQALVDRLYTDESADFADAAAGLPEAEDRWRAYLRHVRSMYANREATVAYFDIAALALRDPALGARLARLNAGTIRAFDEAIGGSATDESRPLAELVFAAIDGIELHRALATDDYPVDAVLELLEQLVIAAMSGPPGEA
jgi:AcrR family transcriptional regulator